MQEMALIRFVGSTSNKAVNKNQNRRNDSEQM